MPYLQRMNPGDSSSALEYALTASADFSPLASVAPNLFHNNASLGRTCSAARKQSVALSSSPESRESSETWNTNEEILWKM